MNRKIAILGGSGPLGSGLALRWVRAGETVIIGSRDAERAQTCAGEILERIRSTAPLSKAARQSFFPVGPRRSRSCHSEEVAAATDEESAFGVKNGRSRSLSHPGARALERGAHAGSG